MVSMGVVGTSDSSADRDVNGMGKLGSRQKADGESRLFVDLDPVLHTIAPSWNEYEIIMGIQR